MTHGIKIVSDITGATQIDDRFSGMGLTQTAAVTMTFLSNGPQPIYGASVSVTGVDPIIALASATPVSVDNITQSGSTFTFHLRAYANTSFSVSYWIFDNADLIPGPAANTWGARIKRRDDPSKTAFHHLMLPLRFQSDIQMDAPPDGWNGSSADGAYIETVTVPGGKAWAVVQGSLCFRSETYKDTSELYAFYPEPGNSIFIERAMSSASSVNGSTISAGLFTKQAYQTQFASTTADVAHTYGNLSFWIIDVTNYGGAIPSADFTLDPVNWNNLAINTTSNYGGPFNHTGQNMTGIDQPVALKATVSGYSGNLTNGIIRMLNYNSGSPIVLDSASWTGAATLEGTVTNGQHIYFDFDASTASGIRSGSATVTVQNMSDQGVIIDTFPIAATVDSDNNYNLSADKTPAPVNWNDIYQPSEGGYTTGYGNSQTITSIDVPITLQIDATSLYASGSAANQFQGGFDLYADINGGTPILIASKGAGGFGGGGATSQSASFEVAAGQSVRFFGSMSATDQLDGYASGSGGCYVSVKNASTGLNEIDTFSVTVFAEGGNL